MQSIRLINLVTNGNVSNHFDIIILKCGYTPLHLAVQHGLIPVVETLIRLQVDVNVMTMVIT